VLQQQNISKVKFLFAGSIGTELDPAEMLSVSFHVEYTCL
jgi:hypothetical protein